MLEPLGVIVFSTAAVTVTNCALTEFPGVAKAVVDAGLFSFRSAADICPYSTT